ncbi:MAG: 50S ribosomal protein L35 [Miltoncostaeaceae bacterium]|nr:50S ribosomal protein L35 [Acidobacteriota bacterium]
MPKMKTNKSASKRFRVTRKGKVMYVHSGLRHNLEHKSAKLKRSSARPAEMAEVDRPEILRLLGRR